jgi:LmbE family N-acetylglucosaminyl deacetylase
MRLSALRLSPTALASMGGWLVLSPHQDDETLGAASIIAALAAQGRPPFVAFVSDGSASHRNAPEWPPARIARTRALEARHALRALGASGGRVLELGWPDSEPFREGSPEFAAGRDRLARLCRREGIRAIAATWRHEPHIDHQAAHALARAVARESRGRVEVFEYLVWGWTTADLVARTRNFAKVALNAPGAARLGRRAILHHRTQLWPLIQGAEAEFRLAPDMVALAGRDPTLLLRERSGHAS